MSPGSLHSCRSCGRFAKTGEEACPYCGSVGTSLGRSTRAALIGLAIGGSFACVAEAKYGSPAVDDTGDTADTAEEDSQEQNKENPE
jgi:hypothetical protein